MGRNRDRYSDVGSVGNSRICPYKPYESPASRHHRRLQTNVSARDEMDAFCSEFGIEFDILNDGHHWRFRKDNKVIEWWPSSAKMVMCKDWRNGIHVHDYRQVQRVLHSSGLCVRPQKQARPVENIVDIVCVEEKKLPLMKRIVMAVRLVFAR